jgi:hypothetical protein
MSTHDDRLKSLRGLELSGRIALTYKAGRKLLDFHVSRQVLPMEEIMIGQKKATGVSEVLSNSWGATCKLHSFSEELHRKFPEFGL